MSWTALALASALWGAAGAGAPAPAARVAVEPEGHDFGEVRQQQTLGRDFRLVNFGEAELRIGRISTSCGCTVVELGQRVLAPGESTRLKVELHTRLDRGPVVRTILVETNDPDRKRVQIELRATVVESSGAGREAR